VREKRVMDSPGLPGLYKIFDRSHIWSERVFSCWECMMSLLSSEGPSVCRGVCAVFDGASYHNPWRNLF
jgi:hypothetical protein